MVKVEDEMKESVCYYLDWWDQREDSRSIPQIEIMKHIDIRHQTWKRGSKVQIIEVINQI